MDFLRKGLNSSGTNQYPVRTKLMPMFLLFLNKPTVFQLILLYSTADENAINTDLILMSPKVRIFSSLNFVMLSAHWVSMFLH